MTQEEQQLAPDWLYHDSRARWCRHPGGAVPCGQEVTLALAVRAAAPVRVTLRLWREGAGEERLPMAPAESRPDGAVLYRAAAVMPAAPDVVWYYFAVDMAGTTYYYGDNADRWGGEGQITAGEPPSFQITVYQPSAALPAWFLDAVVYQIFVDRFYNGAADGQVLHPRPGAVLHACWSDPPFYVRDCPTQRIVAYDFFGGNLPGVESKLPYLQDLGVTALYFNPIFDAVSNHKYDTADYLAIDPMFGDEAAFRRLCQAARAAGINVILDGVFSHTGSDSRYFNKYGRYAAPGAYQSPASPYYRWYRFRRHPDDYECWWGIDDLPNVEENEPSYREFIITGADSVLHHWLRAGARGWRLDVADELPDDFIRAFRRELKRTDAEAVLIGEVWEDASRKVSYGTLRRYLLGEELDSATGYPFRRLAIDFILARRSAADTARALLSIRENYPPPYFYGNLNLLGSHDVPRILTLLGEAPPAAEMTPAAEARYRLPPDKRRLAVARLKVLALWQMTFPGVPCVYYGDEAGAEGYADPYNRGTYPWGHEDAALLAWYQQVIALRRRRTVLRTGGWRPVYAADDVLAYVRWIHGGRDALGRPQADDAALVALNRGGGSAATLTVDVSAWWRDGEALRDGLTGETAAAVTDGHVTLRLPPLSGTVLLRRPEPAAGETRRAAGLLLPVSALPGGRGVGDMGPAAYRWVDFLRRSGQRWWQILPLHPLGLGCSPYAAPSAFAGNALFISLDMLAAQGWLTPPELAAAPDDGEGAVDYARAEAEKDALLRRAFRRFSQHQPPDYEAFVAAHSDWLEDWALFAALKRHFPGRAWYEWETALARREAGAMARWRRQLDGEMAFQRFVQYVFFCQWRQLHDYARRQGVGIIGDLPLYVAADSCDVWAQRELFALDEDGRPSLVAGVPPDYFSATGQLWGQPVYDWPQMAAQDYRWWWRRLGHLLSLVDMVRLDHFRGLAAYWEVPADAADARSGRWVPGPGRAFFAALQRQLGPLPLIAEDLGFITPDVEDLRRELGLPGMAVLQFAWAPDERGRCRPAAAAADAVVYTGTHDNDTVVGWYKKSRAAAAREAACAARYLNLSPHMSDADVAWRFLACAYASPARLAIIPLQDVLGLDSDARLNTPGTVNGNWRWRCPAAALTPVLARRLAALVTAYARQGDDDERE